MKAALQNDSSDDEAKSETPGAGANEEERKEGDEIAPLANLKRTIKARILELAQYNSEQTVYLVETYLSDGDFQERLIME